MDPAEVEEIRSEEAELIEYLNHLVRQFLKHHQDSALPLTEFLLDHWQKTMLAELSAKDEVPEPVREQWKEVGVVLNRDPSATERHDSECDLTERN